MGNFAPLFLAFILNCYGVYIYKTASFFNYFPYVSYLIFLLSLFNLMWHTNFLPTSFRNLQWFPKYVLEFTISMFIMEFVAHDFWLPLEVASISYLPKIVDFVETFFSSVGMDCDRLYDVKDFLEAPMVGIISSYILSSFLLFCSLTATKTIDVKLISTCGTEEFINSIYRKFQTRYCKTFNSKKRKAIAFSRNIKHKLRRNSCYTNNSSTDHLRQSPSYSDSDYCYDDYTSSHSSM